MVGLRTVVIRHSPVCLRPDITVPWRRGCILILPAFDGITVIVVPLRQAAVAVVGVVLGDSAAVRDRSHLEAPLPDPRGGLGAFRIEAHVVNRVGGRGGNRHGHTARRAGERRPVVLPSAAVLAHPVQHVGPDRDLLEGAGVGGGLAQAAAHPLARRPAGLEVLEEGLRHVQGLLLAHEDLITDG